MKVGLFEIGASYCFTVIGLIALLSQRHQLE